MARGKLAVKEEKKLVKLFQTLLPLSKDAYR